MFAIGRDKTLTFWVGKVIIWNVENRFLTLAFESMERLAM